MKPRIFNPRGVAGIDQGHGADEHCLLHCRYDDDLIGMAARPAKITDVGRDGLAQIGIAMARPIAQQVGALLREDFRSQSFP